MALLQAALLSAAAGAGEVASAAAAGSVHGNAYTGLLNAVPMRAHRHFLPAQFESNETSHATSYAISHTMLCREHMM